jgi:putative glycosyltransferase (TIGR04372 family)
VLSLSLIAIPIVIIVRVIRPFLLVRFRSLNSPRIGHFAANTELFLCERDIGLHGGRTLDIFYLLPQVCNKYLELKWKQQLHISSLARPLDIVNRLVPGGGRHVIPISSDKDVHGLLVHTRTHIEFTPKEEESGQTALEELCIPKDAPFVCLYTRDSAYLSSTYPTWGEWGRHDFRDSSIHHCIPAAEELAKRGYLTLRMGAIVKDALKTTNPRIIDYASKGRTDFLDIFLCSHCSFFIGSTAGLSAIPRIFRRPIAYINFIPLEAEHLLSCASNSLFIPKKLWIKEKKRLMTFPEIVNSGVGKFNQSHQYEKLGIELIENTPEEITALALEMDCRLKGTWQSAQEDEELQQRFLSQFKPIQPQGPIKTRVAVELDKRIKWTWQRTSEDEELQKRLRTNFNASEFSYGQIRTRIGAEFLRDNREILG